MAIDGAVWEAMCPPARERYVRPAAGRLRELTIRAFEWDTRRRAAKKPDGVGVNARILDGFDPEAVEIRYVNGREY